jgi:hypothetical protein
MPRSHHQPPAQRSQSQRREVTYSKSPRMVREITIRTKHPYPSPSSKQKQVLVSAVWPRVWPKKKFTFCERPKNATAPDTSRSLVTDRLHRVRAVPRHHHHHHRRHHHHHHHTHTHTLPHGPKRKTEVANVRVATIRPSRLKPSSLRSAMI